MKRWEEGGHCQLGEQRRLHTLGITVGKVLHYGARLVIAPIAAVSLGGHGEPLPSFESRVSRLGCPDRLYSGRLILCRQASAAISAGFHSACWGSPPTPHI